MPARSESNNVNLWANVLFIENKKKSSHETAWHIVKGPYKIICYHAIRCLLREAIFKERQDNEYDKIYATCTLKNDVRFPIIILIYTDSFGRSGAHNIT